MSYLQPHLHSGFAVDQAILSVRRAALAACRQAAPLPPHLAPALPQEEDRVVIIRFGHDYDDTCMQMDEARASCSSFRRRRRLLPPPLAPPTDSLWCTAECALRSSRRFHSTWRIDSPAANLQGSPLSRSLSSAPAAPQILAGTAERMKNFAVIYLVDISEVPDFNAMYELYDPCTVMFFFRNKVRCGGWSWAGRWAAACRGWPSSCMSANRLPGPHPCCCAAHHD